MNTKSWFDGQCCDCGFNVIITQPDVVNFPISDYWWYCSNKLCKNHIGDHTGDLEKPSWVTYQEVLKKDLIDA